MSSIHQSLTISKFIGIILIFMLILQYASRQAQRPLIMYTQDKLILLFILSLFICLIPALHLGQALDTIRRHLTCISFYFLLIYFLNSARLLKSFILTLVVAVTVAALTANIGYALKIESLNVNAYFTSNEAQSLRAVGDMSDPNYFATMVLLVIPFCFNYFIYEKRPSYKLLILAGLLNNIFSVIITFSRSGFICLIAIALLLFIQNRNHFKNRLKIQQLFPVLMLTSAIIALLIILAPQSYSHRIFSIANPKDTAALRRWTYVIVGAKEFVNHPLLGIGPGNFPVAYANSGYGKLFGGNTFESKYRMAHNTYIEIITGCGLLSLPFFLLLFSTLKENNRLIRQIRLSGENQLEPIVKSVHISFIGLLISALFLSLGTHKYLWLLIAATVILKEQISGSAPKITCVNHTL